MFMRSSIIQAHRFCGYTQARQTICTNAVFNSLLKKKNKQITDHDFPFATNLLPEK